MDWKLRIGVCADVHNDDKMPDCNERLQAFVDEMNLCSLPALIRLPGSTPRIIKGVMIGSLKG
jgi:hypothetical protein